MIQCISEELLITTCSCCWFSRLRALNYQKNKLYSWKGSPIFYFVAWFGRLVEMGPWYPNYTMKSKLYHFFLNLKEITIYSNYSLVSTNHSNHHLSIQKYILYIHHIIKHLCSHLLLFICIETLPKPLYIHLKPMWNLYETNICFPFHVFLPLETSTLTPPPQGGADSNKR